MNKINIKEVLLQGVKCFAANPFFSVVHTFMTFLFFVVPLIIGLVGVPAIIVGFFIHWPFSVYAGFYVVGKRFYAGKKVSFNSFWEGFSMRKKVRKFSDRILLTIIAAFFVSFIFSITINIPHIADIPVFAILTLIVFSVFILYQIALPFAIFTEEKATRIYAMSRQLMFQQIGPAALLFLILFAINLLGALPYGIGLVITIPFSAYCWQYLWETQAGALRHQDIEAKIEQIGTGE